MICVAAAGGRMGISMYLKSIEIQGFKSFANKIVFEFHNGITGIVGPNGSGKSNVGDAVRWVLGEQRAKQLRGESMQDVIFAGTENRKPLSYAYVAITLDNADHKLPVEYEEVTVSRRVYRSGESEYLLNGNTCRLKDVNELFYDTGIGKEGYSIIGQGQIERILNGKPEERRELFDEAAGIVKFKRRKATAQKRLERERENLVRVTDILSEQEKQLVPLERQSETARTYLKKKEEQKRYDINLFLLEEKQQKEEQASLESKIQIAEQEMQQTKQEAEQIRKNYEELEQELENLERKQQEARQQMNQATIQKGELQGKINVLQEQIRTARLTEEHVKSQHADLDRQQKEREDEQKRYLEQKQGMTGERQKLATQKKEAQKHQQVVQQQNDAYRKKIEQCKTDLIQLLNESASIKANQQRYDTMLEQIHIRKAQLTQQLLQRKSDEQDLDRVLLEYEEELQKTEEEINEAVARQRDIEEKRFRWKKETEEESRKFEQVRQDYQRSQSKLETLKGIAERYDGYGGSIRHVMEQKEREPGILGVVADLIQVDKRYELAVETALGGSIRHIVTAEEDTAKRMIGFLKQNRYGRATFLPLTSVGKNNVPFRNPGALEEPGVIGRAHTLVKTEERFQGVMEYLLGRIVIVDTLDHAVRIARKYRYGLHIVTVEGESLSPGGSMTGGAFKNSNNLLGRKREIEELSHHLKHEEEQMKRLKARLDDISTARELLKEDLSQLQEELQQLYLKQNTARMNRDRANEQKTESDKVYRDLKQENQELDEQEQAIQEKQEQISTQITQAEEKEQQLKEESRRCQERLQAEDGSEKEAAEAMTKLQLEEANLQQQEGFYEENLQRIHQELERIHAQRDALANRVEEAQQDATEKQQEITQILEQIETTQHTIDATQQQVQAFDAKREEKNRDHKGFFEQREQTANHMAALDKELFRLNGQKEKIETGREERRNEIWEEYELTPHAANELREEAWSNVSELKQKLHEVKEEIRKLGNVNVNAIEDYRELSERYTFLKGQHDDLVEAEQALLRIIEELDTGMRRQFAEKFAEIQKEFDKVFKELFGGGKGTLELVEEEDILECGIRIIAQPPGKKLQNMMQLSGGEKSLTAIALLFAIQNLKPSPFCLLDEIEAALDDSNVTRFAKYLGKLTRNTQFIVITHRRGSMAAADRLYGITMQEKGVSTLVAVNLIEKDLDK